ncbi:MAG TPA: tail fiber domain-containing protein, partial [Myxococcales bacterium]|nr:tail fiber domain-containing protein [Myxococcales bacterium]
EQEMIDLIIVNLARLVCAGEWNGLLSAGGGAETLGELTDVSLDIADFEDSLLIQTNSNGAAPTTGTLSGADNNLGIGKDVLAALTNGNGNIAIGENCLKALTGGDDNIAIGKDAGSAGNRSESIYIGKLAGAAGGANQSIHIGANSGEHATGHTNTCLGKDSGDYMNLYQNVAIGAGTLSDSDYGGKGAIALGYNAGSTITTGNFNVIIGAAAPAAVDANSQLVISNGSDANVKWIVGTDAGTCYQGDNAATWSTTSDRKLKREIADATKGLDAIKAIQVRTFRYRKDNPYNMDPELARVGVIAQELEEIFPEAVKENGHGHKTVSTDSINWALLRAVQELSAKVEALESAQ